MRTANICPTCATYFNAVCVIYDGPAVLANIPASPDDNIDEILVALNTTLGDIDTDITDIQSDITDIYNIINNQGLQETLTIGNTATLPIILSGNTFFYTGAGTRNLFLGATITSVPGVNNIHIGRTGINNTGDNGIFMGLNAGQNNSASTVVAIGPASASSNIGDQLTAVGSNAGGANEGLGVTALGVGSALNNTGDYLSALGHTSANANSGNYVVAAGYLAADTNSGNKVVALGYSAAQQNSGSDVVAIGELAGNLNSGLDNVAIGKNALSNNSGSHNVGIGQEAGIFNTGDNNVFLGEGAGDSNQGTGAIALGVGAGNSNLYDNVLLVGEQATALNNYQFSFTADVATSSYAIIDYNNVSATRTVNFPNASGTMVLSVNGTAPNTAGDVTLGVWKLTGNAGTNPATNFMGTTDATDVVFKCNNVEYLRFNNAVGPTYKVAFSESVWVTAPANNPTILAIENVSGGYASIGANALVKGFVEISKDGAATGAILASNLTAARTHELPNADGTFVLSVNGTAPDAAGNVTLTVAQNVLISQVTLSASDIANMDSTPIIAVSAPPAGKVISVQNIAVRTTTGLGWTTSADIALVPFGGSSIIAFTQSQPLSVADGVFSEDVSTIWFSPAPSSVALYFKGSQGIPPSGGTLGATVYISYILLDL